MPADPMLPPPEPALRRRSRAVSARIRDDIAARGWIGFDRFMQHALHAPGLGYYSGALAKFGAGGDFVTAPMLGDVAARCLARQCAEVLDAIGHGDIVEFGAGNGDLAAEMLLAMDEIGRPPRRYCIIETSAELQARQRAVIAERCGALSQRAHWLDRLPPNGFDGVALANEVLDAMPTTRFEINRNGEAMPLGVGVSRDGDEASASGDGGGDDDNTTFHWTIGDKPLDVALQQRLAPYGLAPGYRGEIGLQAEAWTRALGAHLNTGVALLLDYGFPRGEFYHPERRDGTLMCHYRHVAHDNPFFHPGLQDISVHIDFTAIADAARETSLELAGFASQGAFLLSLGALDLLAQRQRAAESDAHARQQAQATARQIKQLTLPHEMGELFKVIALRRNYRRALSGFSLHDRSGSLR
ncbi:MAG: class I SAM-dependent methyltransferase [bacterium]